MGGQVDVAAGAGRLQHVSVQAAAGVVRGDDPGRGDGLADERGRIGGPLDLGDRDRVCGRRRGRGRRRVDRLFGVDRLLSLSAVLRGGCREREVGGVVRCVGVFGVARDGLRVGRLGCRGCSRVAVGVTVADDIDDRCGCGDITPGEGCRVIDERDLAAAPAHRDGAVDVSGEAGELGVVPERLPDQEVALRSDRPVQLRDLPRGAGRRGVLDRPPRDVDALVTGVVELNEIAVVRCAAVAAAAVDLVDDDGCGGRDGGRSGRGQSKTRRGERHGGERCSGRAHSP